MAESSAPARQAGIEALWFSLLEPGVARTLAMPLLVLAALAFHAARLAKFWIFRLRLFPRTRLEAFTVSIGNLAVGGTGKTPATLLVARFLSERQGSGVAVLCRGYGSRNREWVRRVSDGGALAADAGLGGDEAYLLASGLTGASVYVGKRRALTGRAAAADGHAAVVLDDGFQYWRLERDLDIVCFSALWPLEAYRLFPIGILREPLARLRDARFALVSGAGDVPPEQVARLERTLREAAPGIGIARIDSTIRGLSCPGTRELLGGRELVAGKRVLAVSNIVNPSRFLKSLARDLGAEGAALAFPDHHCHAPADVKRMFARAVAERAHAIVATEKDEQSLAELALPHSTIPLWIARSEPVLSGEVAAELLRALAEGLGARRAAGGAAR
ncbi:MAG: tetraacyldisaccharide 4'-kinase [Candidatus Wallbacteria bacterium]|nr:tetraacyldisaccharide 4'-kinase [Candidatus Wallbacteria bacterium]